MSKKKTWIIWGTVLLAIAVSVYFFIFSKPLPEAQAENPAMIKRNVKLERQRLKVEVTAMGTIQPIYKIDIKSKASGSVLSLRLQEGDRVKKGEIIATIEKTDALAAYNQAKADADVAKANLKQLETTLSRRKNLFEGKLISEEEMETATLEYERAKAQVVRTQASFEQAEIRLNDCVVRSPVEGIVLDKVVDEGQVIMGGLNAVSGGTTIVTIADMQKVYIIANIDEVDIGRVRIGQQAQIIADAFPNQRFVGRVLRIDPLAKVEQNVTRFPVVIEVPNPDYRLLAGMNATVTIVITDRENALVIPIEVLREAGEGRMGAAGGAASGGVPPTANGGGWERRGSREGGDTVKISDEEREKRRARMMAFRSKMEEFRSDSSLKNAGIVPQMRLASIKDTASGEFRPVPIIIGSSNAEFAEVLFGAKDGDEVQITTFSRALMEGRMFQERMRQSSGFGGAPSGGGGGRRNN
ncbi:MAG: efflux RND transporter periplasmic adaptor subunit [Chloroherpetonaceae bacterium]|nr:efflux RND transporter periplasmic adaptor subunit [Chloroherpetonaceae bacterium]